MSLRKRIFRFLKHRDLEKSNVKITVTDDDIKQGKRYKPQECPIALAAKRSFPGKAIIVGTEHLSVYESETALDRLAKYGLCQAARAFRHNFDQHGLGAPFEFELGEVVP